MTVAGGCGEGASGLAAAPRASRRRGARKTRKNSVYDSTDRCLPIWRYLALKSPAGCGRVDRNGSCDPASQVTLCPCRPGAARARCKVYRGSLFTAPWPCTTPRQPEPVGRARPNPAPTRAAEQACRPARSPLGCSPSGRTLTLPIRRGASARPHPCAADPSSPRPPFNAESSSLPVTPRRGCARCPVPALARGASSPARPRTTPPATRCGELHAARGCAARAPPAGRLRPRAPRSRRCRSAAGAGRGRTGGGRGAAVSALRLALPARYAAAGAAGGARARAGSERGVRQALLPPPSRQRPHSPHPAPHPHAPPAPWP